MKLYDFKNVAKQTPKFCMAMIKKHPASLQYIENQTPEICMMAVKKNGGTIQFVKNQTPELCLAAIKQENIAINYIKDRNILDEIINAKFAIEILNNEAACSKIYGDILGFLRQKVMAAAMTLPIQNNPSSRVTRRQAQVF